MTLNKRSLKQFKESMRLTMSESQRAAILDRFSSEPEPYEWSEQDITVQILNFLGCGEFVRPIRDTRPNGGLIQVFTDEIPF